jgi:hypothetical protein
MGFLKIIVYDQCNKILWYLFVLSKLCEPIGWSSSKIQNEKYKQSLNFNYFQ